MRLGACGAHEELGRAREGGNRQAGTGKAGWGREKAGSLQAGGRHNLSLSVISSLSSTLFNSIIWSGMLSLSVSSLSLSLSHPATFLLLDRHLNWTPILQPPQPQPWCRACFQFPTVVRWWLTGEERLQPSQFPALGWTPGDLLPAACPRQTFSADPVLLPQTPHSTRRTVTTPAPVGVS